MQLHLRRLAVVRCADSCVDCSFRFARRFFDLRPGVLSIWRAFAISACIHRQRVRPPPIGTDTEGLIFPSANQRFTVRKETPILSAASLVLYVLAIPPPFFDSRDVGDGQTHSEARPLARTSNAASPYDLWRYICQIEEVVKQNRHRNKRELMTDCFFQEATICCFFRGHPRAHRSSPPRNQAVAGRWL
jgi:hypothetical protein